MVVMDVSGLLAERGVPAHVWPRNFVVIDQGCKLYQNARKRRYNPLSDSRVPEGFVVCRPPCTLLAEIDFESKTAKCPEGHEIDLEAEEQKQFDPGGNTRVGLTLKDQGDIGEDIIQNLKSLGFWGKIIEWCQHYNAPLDGITSAGWGIEVKTKSTRATKMSFEPGNKKSRARKIAEAERRNLRGILEVLVILDFDISKARIFIKERPRGEDLKFWSIPLGNPYAVVDFTDLNPFAPKKKEGEKTEIPF